MTETIRNPKSISDLWDYFAPAMRGEVVVAPEAYDQLSYRGEGANENAPWKGGASDNWDLVASTFDLLNHYLRNPTLSTEEVLLNFFRNELLGNKRFMQGEFFSWIYGNFHFSSASASLFYARKMAERNPAWRSVADGLRLWLRAGVGWLAWGGCWGPGFKWAERFPSGGRLLVGTEINQRVCGAFYSVCGGGRSWEVSGTNSWYQNLWGPVYLSALGLKENRHGSDLLPHRIISHLGDLGILTDEESAIVARAIRNDIEALEWCRTELIRDWLPANPMVFIRTVGGVGQVTLRAPKEPTSHVDYSGWDSNGTTYAAAPDLGYRGGGVITPHRAEINLENRTGWCESTEGASNRVVFPLPKGLMVAVLEAEFGVGIKARYWKNGVEIQPTPPAMPPVPTPPVRPRHRRRWWEFWR